MTDMSLETLLPHRPPMVLIDGVDAFDAAAGRLVAHVTITPETMFCETDGVPNWVAIEYMAQTAAALAGAHDRLQAPDCPPRPGLLLGTRKLDVPCACFAIGQTYRVTAERVFADDEAASFACQIEDAAGAVVASAILNAYRPPDLETFLKEQAKA